MALEKHYVLYYCKEPATIQLNIERYYPLTGYDYTIKHATLFHIEEEQELKTTLAEICGHKDPTQIKLIQIITEKEYKQLTKPT